MWKYSHRHSYFVCVSERARGIVRSQLSSTNQPTPHLPKKKKIPQNISQSKPQTESVEQEESRICVTAHRKCYAVWLSNRGSWCFRCCRTKRKRKPVKACPVLLRAWGCPHLDVNSLNSESSKFLRRVVDT